MKDVIFLLDGHFSRLIIGKLFGVNATPLRLKSLCRCSLKSNENPVIAYYYDCKPFHKKRPLPVSKTLMDFSKAPSFYAATRFQENLGHNGFFILRLGRLSFDGWKVTDLAVEDFSNKPRIPQDSDFEPVLRQKRVDMKIGMDMTEIALRKTAIRVILFTADDAFTPAIEETRKRGLEIVLVTAGCGLVKNELVQACNEHRRVNLKRLEEMIGLPIRTKSLTSQ